MCRDLRECFTAVCNGGCSNALPANDSVKPKDKAIKGATTPKATIKDSPAAAREYPFHQATGCGVVRILRMRSPKEVEAAKSTPSEKPSCNMRKRTKYVRLPA